MSRSKSGSRTRELRKPRRRYPKEFKEEAVQMMLDGHSAQSVADRLEERRVLSATVSNGVLTVTGGTLWQSGESCQVDSVNGQISVTLYSTQRTHAFPAAGVDRIVFNGTDLADTFVNNTNIRSVVYGGRGNDSLTGGGGIDEIHGGDGNDQICGRAGDDTLYGEDGSDYIYGSEGNDYASGGSGNDFLTGGIGNDRLLGGTHDDRVEGDAGDDQLLGEVGNDWLLGGDGNDSLDVRWRWQ